MTVGKISVAGEDNDESTVFRIGGRYHLLTTAPSANAEVTTKVILDDYAGANASDRDVIQLVMQATANGILSTDSYIANSRHMPRILCVPDEPSLTGARVLLILQNEAEKSQFIMNMPYGSGILTALLMEFGCQNSK